MIFTYVWAFDQKDDWDFVRSICDIFESKDWDVYFVELEADIEQRLERNRSEHRLQHKPTKRNITYSENELKCSIESYRLNSDDGEITRKNYIKNNNTIIMPNEVALMIKEEFQL